MPQNFIESRREQGFLLPPDVQDWLAADHVAWFVIDADRDMDLAAFHGAYRAERISPHSFGAFVRLRGCRCGP
jgi:hypothetical protein